MRRISILGYVAVAILVFSFMSGPAFAGNMELMSTKMAKQDLKRNLTESVIGYKVRSEGQFGLTQEAKYSIQEKAKAVVKGIRVEKVVYDREKDLAFCMGYIDLGDVVTSTDERISYNDVRVHSFGFGTMAPATREPLMALRAAFLNAYDEMAATIVGERISSYSEAENFVLTEDFNRSRVLAAVYGAYVPNPDIDDPNRGWGWDESGNAFVKLHLDLERARDILGQRIIYDGPNIVEVIGYGSQFDELKPDPGSGPTNLTGPSSQTEYRTLQVPTSQSGELKGAYTESGGGGGRQSLTGGGSKLPR